MRLLSVKQVADRTGLSTQTVRRQIRGIKIGRSVRIDENDLAKFFNRRALEVIHGDQGLTQVMKDFYIAEAAIDHMDPNPDARADADMALLLVSTIAAGRIEHPDWPVIGDNAVFPPTLAFLKANPPQGGGAKGDALRGLIESA